MGASPALLAIALWTSSLDTRLPSSCAWVDSELPPAGLRSATMELGVLMRTRVDATPTCVARGVSLGGNPGETLKATISPRRIETIRAIPTMMRRRQSSLRIA